MFRIANCDDSLDDLNRVCAEVKNWLSIHSLYPIVERDMDWE